MNVKPQKNGKGEGRQEIKIETKKEDLKKPKRNGKSELYQGAFICDDLMLELNPV